MKIRITKDAIYDGRKYRAGIVGYADARTAIRLVNAGIAEYVRQEELRFDAIENAGRRRPTMRSTKGESGRPWGNAKAGGK